MKERPILFNPEMVRAVLDGRKTQTRRVVKPQPSMVDEIGPWQGRNPHSLMACPYGRPGDRLWVREAFRETRHRPHGSPCDEVRTFYRADYPAGTEGPWKPGIHMFRKVSRITLEITNVRVERVQEISDRDAMREGAEQRGDNDGAFVAGFELLWDSINASRHGCDWLSNPWVWCVSFRVIKP
jgi:hypothetical protein